MGEWLRSLIPWGIQVILWFQAHSTPWLDTIAKGFTTLGYEEFYLLLLPFIYWCVSRPIGVGLGYISLLSAWLNSLVKYLFAIPRPFTLDSRVQMKAPRPETSPSFPSGHAQNAAADWGYLALRFRKPWLWIGAVIAILGIGLSRIVLGVHFPEDVIGGWLIGLVLLALFASLERPLGRWLARQRMGVRLILAVGLPVLLIFLHPADTNGLYPTEGAVTPMSAMAGLGIGLVMERAWVRFRVDGTWLRRVVRFVVGLLVVGVLYVGLAQLVPAGLAYGVETGLRFVRYALLGWAVAFLCPWLFVRLKLAEREA